VGKGLSYLHDRGIVHRDLKPGNIFYEDGYVKIGDYGLAKLMAASQHSGQTVSVGTVHYMAPEVGSGNYDRTIDIYALGVMLYEMLLGRVPFSGATMGEVLMKHLTAQPEVDELPQPFPRVIRKALAKDPKDRYQTVQEMLSEVFAEASIDESVAAFEPAGLSTLAAHVAGRVRVSPIHAGAAAGAATLTGIGTGSSNVGRRPPPPVPLPGGHRGAGRFGRLQQRVGAGVDRIARRIDDSPMGQQMSQAVAMPGRNIERILIALLVTGGVSFAVSLLSRSVDHKAAYAAIVFLHIASIVQGVAVGTYISFQRLNVAGVWVPRLIIAGLACAGLAFSSEVASQFRGVVGIQPERWLPALMLSMIFCDWAGRYFAGRKGVVSPGSAFAVAIFGVAAGMVLAKGQGFAVAAIMAAASIAVQAIGSLWPLAADATVPRTTLDGDEGGKEEQAEDDSDEVPAPVAVEPPGFSRAATGSSAAAARTIPVHLAPDASQTDPRLRRSTVIRSLWLMVAAVALVGMILLYVTPHIGWFEGPVLMSNSSEDEAVFTILGTIAASFFLFCFSRAIPAFKSGLWRGLFRPAVFFGGVAMAASCGIALGLIDPKGEAGIATFVGILAGGITCLLVWFVPIAPYAPLLANPEGDEIRLRIRRARRLRRAGIWVMVLGVALIGIMFVTLDEFDFDDVIPPVATCVGLLSIGLIVAGAIKERTAGPRTKPPKLSLPLRRVFEIDANSNLSRLIERHLAMFGYKLTGKSDMLWSFERGNWTAQFWQSDIRQWKIRCNVAAYELDTGGLRLTCYIDMEASFNEPDQKQLAALMSEIDDLQGLLGGRPLDKPAWQAVTA
jgi:hypothetical protein